MLGVRSPSKVVALMAAVLVASCSTGPSEKLTDPVGSLSSALATSAAKANVPRDLLVAIANVEEGLTHPRERASIDVDNDVPAAGPLQLRRGKLDTLRRGAELTGASEIDLRMHGDLALEAGALVLGELGRKYGANADDLASWSRAIEEMSGFADQAHRENYVHQVFATLARGGSFPSGDGEIIVLPRHDLPPSLTTDVSGKLRTLAQAQYEGAEWIPTSCTDKCTEGRGGFKVELVVIHDTEGNWNASVATLQNDPGKSVHYIVDIDGRVGQFVTEDTTAWHAGNFNFNQRSVGIEHVGFATKPFPEPLYASSAKLVEHLTDKYELLRDRAHIIGHDQVPNGRRIAQTSPPCSDAPKQCQANSNYGGASHHTDPGIWEWATFMVRFGGEAKCNDVTEAWKCSNDRGKAFRCATGKVEVETCDGPGGCEPMATGTDDVCHVAPKTTTEPPTAQPSGFLEAQNDVGPPEETGCGVGLARNVMGADGKSPLAIAAGTVFLALGRRKRRR